MVGTPLVDTLDDAEGARLLRPAGPGRFAFSHALVRDAVYAELGVGERVRQHERVAEALAVLAAEVGAVEPAVLAHHYAQAAPAGRAADAVHHALTAARAATAVLGYPEAADHLAVAVELPSSRERSSMRLNLGRSRMLPTSRPRPRAPRPPPRHRARTAGP